MTLKYVECPRDSWQGLHKFIPTQNKVNYLQALLDAGFKHLDMGSFVSPKAVPQLADTEEVLTKLEPPSDADLLCIVANERGLNRALQSKNITSIGYPLSVNDTFQKRNTNRSLKESWTLVEEMNQNKEQLKLVIYLSMGFGNPYRDNWQAQDTARAVDQLRTLGITNIALADTVGNASPKVLKDVLAVIPEPQTLGLHLHAKPNDWQHKLELALDYGLTWFEGAFAGVGGCPFAEDVLVGNLATEAVLPFLANALKLDKHPDLKFAEAAAGLARDYA